MKKFKAGLIVLTISLFSVITPIRANTPTIKTKTIVIGEGSVDQQTLAGYTDIPNLRNIVGVTVNTGNVSYSVTGERINISVTGGSPSRQVNNPKKYSKNVYEYIESNNDREYYPDQLYTTSLGYSGFLEKSGSVRERKSQESKIEYAESSRASMKDLGINNWNQLSIGMLQNYFGYTYRYGPDRWGYVGELSSGVGIGYGVGGGGAYLKYRGTVYAITITYTQEYYGTIYKPGTDNYYSYTVTIKYIDNTAPTTNLLTPTNNQIRSDKTGFNTLNITGTVMDPDIDNTLTIYYKIDNQPDVQITSFKATGSNQSFSRIVDVGSLNEGNHTLKVWSRDSEGDISNEITRAFRVDKTSPVVTFTPNGNAKAEKSYDPGVSVVDTISGVNRVEYTWSNEVLPPPTGWTTVKTTLSKGDGMHYLHVKALDNVGNEKIYTSGGFNMDNTPPTMQVISDIETWRPAPIVVTVKASDSNAGVKRIRSSTGNWINGDTVTLNVNSNGEYHFESEDNAGNMATLKVTVSKIDDIIPEEYELVATEVGKNNVVIKARNAVDNQSGLHDKPYRFALENGAWSEWTSNDSMEFTGLEVNKRYKFKSQVRDKAMNVRDSELTVSTATDDIELTFKKTEGINEALLSIALKSNPPGTETMIARQNLTTLETVTIKGWNTNTTHLERVQTFETGYRYTAYARNQDGIVGQPSTVTIREFEDAGITVKGYGKDKYIYDEVGEKLFIFGNPSGHIVWEVMTESTEEMTYRVTDSSGRLVGSRDEFGRVGEYRYSVISQLNPNIKEQYTIELNSKWSDKVNTKTVTVYKISTLADILDINSEENTTERKNSFKYNYKTNYGNTVYQEVGTDPEIRKLFEDIILGVDNKKHVASVNNILETPTGALTLEKEMGGGTYVEPVRTDWIKVSTNISSSNIRFDNKWELKVQVRTKDKVYNLPQDIGQFKSDGFRLEGYLLKESNEETGGSQASYNNIANKTGGTYFTEDTITTLPLSESMKSQVSLKVTKQASVYLTENLNLTKIGGEEEFKGEIKTLDAIGNKDYEYDNNYLYNTKTNTSESHNTVTYTNGEWVSELYYMEDSSGTRLNLVTRDGIKVFRTTLKEVESESRVLSNIGSISLGGKVYLGTASGVQELDPYGKTRQTVFTRKVNAITTDGFKIFVAVDEGLVVLNKELVETQFIRNQDLFGTSQTIKSLHTSNGRIYVGKDLKGNEYVVIGK